MSGRQFAFGISLKEKPSAPSFPIESSYLDPRKEDDRWLRLWMLNAYDGLRKMLFGSLFVIAWQ